MAEMEIKSGAENTANMLFVKKYWNLGPLKASTDPVANKDYWSMMAKVWNTTETIARTQLCSNCKYYDNTSEMMLEMNKIPQNEFDADGGGRGYCHKFEFICHNLRTCQAWEGNTYEEDEQDKKHDMMMKSGRSNPMPMSRSK